VGEQVAVCRVQQRGCFVLVNLIKFFGVDGNAGVGRDVVVGDFVAHQFVVLVAHRDGVGGGNLLVIILVVVWVELVQCLVHLPAHFQPFFRAEAQVADGRHGTAVVGPLSPPDTAVVLAHAFVDRSVG